MGPSEWIGVIAGVLAIVGAIVGVTRYITQMQFKVRQEQLEGDLKRLRERYTELDARHEELVRVVTAARNVGTAALVKKTDIDVELSAAMEAVQASASSILVPEPVPDLSITASNFVFLSIFGPVASKLRRSRVEIKKGIAGYVYTQGKPYLAPDTEDDSRFSDRVDKRSRFRTMDILCTPLRHEGKIIGVVQFLNKKGQGNFDAEDLQIAERFASSLSAKVADFIRNPENFDLLGITSGRAAREATILFCDITDSGRLFEATNISVAIDLINDYLERQCDIALSHGATVDKYLGDGVMLRFNVPRAVEDHSYKAVQAALQMQRDFEELKEGWVNYGLPAGQIYNRIGIACGPVYEATIGHPQYQYITVMGDPVNLAHNLCEAADRSKNIVVVDQRIQEELGERLLVQKLSLQVKETTLTSYELVGIK